MNKFFISIVITLLLSICISGIYAESTVILYTNDVHCGYEDNLTYSAVAALKDFYKSVTPNVLLVDNGDAIQGDVIGAVSQGEYIIDFMNDAEYDYAILGNHEFDYGLDQLAKLAEMADFPYITCNIKYTGTQENKLDFLKPYVIHDFGDIKVGFVGVDTPQSISTSNPVFFQENGEYVYDFGQGEKGAVLYGIVQDAVDAARAESADYVILLSHLGSTDEVRPYSSIDVIENTHGIDACLDGHTHSVIPSTMIPNDEGYLIPLSSTGTKLEHIGILNIADDGVLTTTIVDGSLPRSRAFDAKETVITDEFNKTINQVMASSNVDLWVTDADGFLLIRYRETNLGDLVADAYRYVTGADVAIVNGGSIRTNIAAGDLTFADIKACNPYGKEIFAVKATGQQILDALEWTSRKTQSEFKASDGSGIGGLPGFLQVAGLRYTIDTSIDSPAIADDKDMFFGFIEDAPRRVTDVEVQKDGEWTAIDPQAEYILASQDYILADGGDGITMFREDPIVSNPGVPDYMAVVNYIKSLDGDLSDYAEPQGRITVK